MADIKLVLKMIDQASAPLNRSLKRVDRAVNRLKGSFSALKAAIAAYGGWRLSKSFVDTAAYFERLDIMLQRVTGSADSSKEAFSYLMDFAATKAPFSLKALSDAFVRMRVAGLKPMHGELQAITDALAAFGRLSDENLRLTILAIEQMVGKGVISLEELRRQLGERLPEAVKIMASELGMSMREFLRAIPRGEISAQRGLEALFRGFKKYYQGAGEAMMRSWSGMMASAKVEWQSFQKEVMDSEVFVTMKAGVRTFLDELQRMRKEGDLSEWALIMGQTVVDVFEGLVKSVYHITRSFIKLKRVLIDIKVIWNRLTSAEHQTFSWLSRVGAWMDEKTAAFYELVGNKQAAKMMRENARSNRLQSLYYQMLLPEDDQELNKLQQEYDDLTAQLEKFDKEWERLGKLYQKNLEKMKKTLNMKRKTLQVSQKEKDLAEKEAERQKELQERLEKIAKNQAALQKIYLASLPEHKRKVEEINIKYKEMLETLERIKKETPEALKGVDYQAIVEGIKKRRDEDLAALNEITKTNKEQAETVSEAWIGAYNRISDSLADMLYEGKLKIKDWLDWIKRAFYGMLSRRVVGGIGAMIGLPGASAWASGGGSLTQGAAGGGGFNLSAISSLFTASAWQSIQSSLAWTLGNTSSGFLQGMADSLLNMSSNVFGGILGAAPGVLQMLQGNFKQGAPSAILGGLGGAFLGPVGAIGGGIIGNLIGSFLGKDKPDNSWFALLKGFTKPAMSVAIGPFGTISIAEKGPLNDIGFKGSEQKKFADHVTQLVAQLDQQIASHMTAAMRQQFASKIPEKVWSGSWRTDDKEAAEKAVINLLVRRYKPAFAAIDKSLAALFDNITNQSDLQNVLSLASDIVASSAQIADFWEYYHDELERGYSAQLALQDIQRAWKLALQLSTSATEYKSSIYNMPAPDLASRFLASYSAVNQMVSAFDYTAEATQSLAQALQTLTNTEVQAVQQIRQAQVAIADLTRSNIDRVLLDTMTAQQRYDFYAQRVAELQRQMVDAIDPARIQQLAGQIQQYAMSAWGLLSEQEKMQYRDAFISFFEGTEGVAQQHLENLQTAVYTMHENLVNTLKPLLQDAVNNFLAAGVQMNNAANTMAAAAQTPQQVDVVVHVEGEAAEAGY